MHKNPVKRLRFVVMIKVPFSGNDQSQQVRDTGSLGTREDRNCQFGRATSPQSRMHSSPNAVQDKARRHMSSTMPIRPAIPEHRIPTRTLWRISEANCTGAASVQTICQDGSDDEESENSSNGLCRSGGITICRILHEEVTGASCPSAAAGSHSHDSHFSSNPKMTPRPSVPLSVVILAKHA